MSVASSPVPASAMRSPGQLSAGAAEPKYLGSDDYSLPPSEYAASEVEVRPEQLWKVNDRKAQKSGPRSTVYFTSGETYAGHWHDNKQSGQGTQTFKSGSKYEGEFMNGVPDGAGTYWLMEGGKLRLSYRGSFANGKREGFGTYTFKNGERYDGQWKNGFRHGKGKMHYNNGDQYDGEWLRGQRSGEGTLHIANGDVYQGEWLDDKKDGRGTLYYIKHQKRYDGVWEKGIAKCGLYGAIDQGDGHQCAVQLPNLELDQPLKVLTDEALEVHERRAERVGVDPDQILAGEEYESEYGEDRGGSEQDYEYQDDEQGNYQPE